MKTPARIPTVVAIIILILGVGSTLFLLENGGRLFSRASASPVPKEVTVTNVSDTSTTISWLTDTPTISALTFNKKGVLGVSQTITDSRDTTQTKTRTVHAVTLTSLDPNTTYSFAVVSGNQTHADRAFTFTTGPTLGAPPESLDPAFGTLLDKNNEAVPEALVYASFEGSQLLSGTVNDGNWAIPLGTLRSEDGKRYFVPSSNDIETVSFVTLSEKSTVKTTIDTDSPQNPAILGEDADTTNKDQTSRGGLIIAQAQEVPTLNGSVNTSTFKIATPKDGAAVPSNKPLFKGTGVAGKYVLLVLSGNGTPITQKITIDSSGNWSWTPKTGLSPGNYVLSATSFAADGKPVVITQSVTILKSGTQVLGDATPSASLEPSPSPIASLLPSPSLIASPSAIASASPSASVPVTGSTEWTFVLLGAAILFLGIGFVSFAHSPIKRT